MGVVRYLNKSFMTPVTRYNHDQRALSCILQDGKEIDRWNELMQENSPHACPKCTFLFAWADVQKEVIASLDVYKESVPAATAILRCPSCGHTVHTELVMFESAFPSVAYAVVYTNALLARNAARQGRKEGSLNGKEGEDK